MDMNDMVNMGDMSGLMQQAQRMQMELARAQEEIQSMTYTASSGGGMVKVTALGDGTLESVVIDPEAVDPDDVEMLQDMVLVAVNEALRGVAAEGERRMGAVTGGLSIPGLF